MSSSHIRPSPIMIRRVALGARQWWVAERAQLRQSRLSQIENCRVRPRQDELERIAAALELKVSDLQAEPADEPLAA